MDLIKIVRVFTTVVNYLLEYRSASGSKIYILTKEGDYLNFKPSAFKKKLITIVGEEETHKYLEYFKKLGFIVTSPKEKKFTNVQWINKKSMRVVSIEAEKYNALLELTKENIDTN